MIYLRPTHSIWKREKYTHSKGKSLNIYLFHKTCSHPRDLIKHRPFYIVPVFDNRNSFSSWLSSVVPQSLEFLSKWTKIQSKNKYRYRYIFLFWFWIVFSFILIDQRWTFESLNYFLITFCVYRNVLDRLGKCQFSDFQWFICIWITVVYEYGITLKYTSNIFISIKE